MVSKQYGSLTTHIWFTTLLKTFDILHVIIIIIIIIIITKHILFIILLKTFDIHVIIIIMLLLQCDVIKWLKNNEGLTKLSRWDSVLILPNKT